MLRTNFFILVVILVLSTLVIQQRHYSRQLFSELESLKHNRDLLNIEWGKLLLEEGAWSQHQRIESLARSRLAMTIPRPDQIEVTVSTGKQTGTRHRK
jgi:cell division protein FtsL